jgi:transposase
LHADHPHSNPDLDAAYAPLAVAQARILDTLLRSRQACLARLDKLFQQHPDREIYDSLPKAGTLLAPALLSKLGDDRARFPTPAVLQAVAGTCPFTKRSGKYTSVLFRTACDREFRHIVQQWARLTLDTSPWAATYYHTVRPHCRTDNDAIRRLANRWLEVLWRLWVDRKPYEEAFHLKQHTLRNQNH